LHLATDVAKYEDGFAVQAIDLHTLRRAAKMSQVELARRALISRPRLSAAENNYIQLEQDELLRVISVLAEEPSRRAAQIRELIAQAPGQKSRLAPHSGLAGTPENATATAELDLPRSFEMYGSKLVQHLKKLMPVPAAEAVAGLATEAVEHEVRTFGLTPQQAYEKIKKAQTVLSKSPTIKRGFIPVRPIAWYRDRRFAEDPKSWEVEGPTR
jgi:hypothetical protein